MSRHPVRDRDHFLSGRMPVLPRTGWRSAAPGVLVAAVIAMLLRLPFIGRPGTPDESGFLIVARRWNTDGSGLYGDLWVDRPPLLILFWRVADVFGGIEAARWFGCGVVAITVIAAGWAGWLIAERRGAHWASFVAAGLVSTPLLAAHAINGELLAAPFIMVSCALTLTAVRRSFGVRTQVLLAIAAGISGICAPLIKQNFVDALVFAVVLVVVGCWRKELSWKRGLRILGFGLLGVAIPIVATLVWLAAVSADWDEFWYALYGFRSDAMQVIATQSLNAPIERLWQLLGAGLLSGVLILSLVYAWGLRRLHRTDIALSIAVAVMLAVGYVSMFAGGSYWLHYLVGLVPASALAGAHLAKPVTNRLFSRSAIALVAVSALIAPAVTVASGALKPDPPERVVKDYLRDAKLPDDTAVVAYGQADLIEAAGLKPGYRYLWSLPMRVLDPELQLLRSRLAKPRGPVWFIEWSGLNAWEIDRQGRLKATVRRNYRPVETVCDVGIYLREDLKRERPTVTEPVDCG